MAFSTSLCKICGPFSSVFTSSSGSTSHSVNIDIALRMNGVVVIQYDRRIFLEMCYLLTYLCDKDYIVSIHERQIAQKQ